MISENLVFGALQIGHFSGTTSSTVFPQTLQTKNSLLSNSLPFFNASIAFENNPAWIFSTLLATSKLQDASRFPSSSASLMYLGYISVYSNVSPEMAVSKFLDVVLISFLILK